MYLTLSKHTNFSNLGLAATANEDTYLTVKDIDGPAWADELRRRMRGDKTLRKGGGEGPDVILSEKNRLLVNPIGL